MKTKISYFIALILCFGVLYWVYTLSIPVTTPVFPNDNPVVAEPDPTPTPVVDNRLKLDETRNYGSTSIKPISVEEDSRCPANVDCIWAGQVRLKVQINGSMSILTLGKEFTTNNFSVTLTEVLPQKTQTAIAPSDYRFTFTVTKQNVPVVSGKCYVGGCSSQLCTDRPNAISTCEYTESYACYKTATCERQASGQCGWTETAELRACLNNK